MSAINCAKPIYYFSSVIGLAPLTITKKGEIKTDKWSVLRSIISLIAYLICNFIVLETILNLYITNNTVNDLVWCYIVYCKIAAVSITILIQTVNRYNIADILNDINELDAEMAENPVLTTNYVNFNYMKVWWFVSAMYSGSVGMSISSFYIFTDLRRINTALNTCLSIIVLHAPMFCVLGILTQVCGFVCLLKQRFQEINMQVNLKSNLNVSEKSDEDIEHQISVIRSSCQIHSKLCDISKQFNSSYSIQILLFIALTFVVVVSQCYYSALGYFDSSFGPLELLLSLNWAIFHMLGVIVLAVSCHRAAQEAAKSGVLLHKMRNRHIHKVKDVIELYSLQMIHQKLSFSAGGLFNIDLTLVYSIIGSITTYLVILIQFNIAGNKKGGTVGNTTTLATLMTTLDS